MDTLTATTRLHWEMIAHTLLDGDSTPAVLKAAVLKLESTFSDAECVTSRLDELMRLLEKNELMEPPELTPIKIDGMEEKPLWRTLVRHGFAGSFATVKEDERWSLRRLIAKIIVHPYFLSKFELSVFADPGANEPPAWTKRKPQSP